MHHGAPVATRAHGLVHLQPPHARVLDEAVGVRDPGVADGHVGSEQVSAEVGRPLCHEDPVLPGPRPEQGVDVVVRDVTARDQRGPREREV